MAEGGMASEEYRTFLQVRRHTVEGEGTVDNVYMLIPNSNCMFCECVPSNLLGTWMTADSFQYK